MISALLLAQESQGEAEESDKEAYPEDTIIITEARERQANNFGSQYIDLLQEENKTANKISEILERQEGLRVNRLGARGTYSNLSIRGNSFNQTGIYIDGVSISDPINSAVNLENLPLEAFESLELHRSHTPLYLIGTNIGGAINLIPRSLKQNEKLYFIHGFANTLVGAGLGLGLSLPWTLQHIKIEASENEYDYYDDNGTPLFNNSDDSISKRKNEDYKSLAYTSYFRFTKGDNLFKVILDYFKKERGLGGTVNAPLNAVRFKTERGLAKLNHRTPFSFLGKAGLIESSIGGSVNHSKTEDPQDELIFGLGEETFITLANQLSTSPHFYFFQERLEIQALLYHVQYKVKKDELSLGDRNETMYGLSVNFQEPGWGRMYIQNKFIEIYDTPKEALQTIIPFSDPLENRKFNLNSQTFRLGFFPLDAFGLVTIKKQTRKSTLNLKTTSFLEVYGMVSSGQRVPTINESYGDGRLLLANPSIEAEESYSKIIGIEGNCQIFQSQVSFRMASFHTQSEKLILFLPNTSHTFRAENLSAVAIDGNELELKFKYQSYLLSIFRFTQLDAIDKGVIPYYKNNRVPFQPASTLEYYLGGGSKKLQVFTNIRWLGSLYRDRANSQSNFIENRVQYDLGSTYYFGKVQKSRVNFSIKNISNEYHSDIIGYPLPSRTYEIQFYKEINL